MQDVLKRMGSVVGGFIERLFTPPLLILALSVVAATIAYSPTWFDTQLIEEHKFEGIGTPNKRNTSSIIVHGIGHHCIGYADSLVRGLMTELPKSSMQLIREAYEQYVDESAGRYAPNLHRSIVVG